MRNKAVQKTNDHMTLQNTVENRAKTPGERAAVKPKDSIGKSLKGRLRASSPKEEIKYVT